jgi:release factor glutamine methyltransferase
MNAAPETMPSVWTIGRLLSWTKEYLASHDVVDARLAGEVLLAHAAKCRRIELYTRFDEALGEANLASFRDSVRRAAAHEPIAYLVGEKEFFSLPFRVTPDVLIPRCETETLVERVIDHCTRTLVPQPKLLDLGTGSGCLAIVALVHLAGATAVATDVSSAALDVACVNSERHGVASRLTLMEADRLALPPRVVPIGGFDVLMCNPPYIATSAMATLDVAVRDYEPRLALTDGDDGLSFYRSIAADGPKLLTSTGTVFVEVADGQAQTVVETITVSGRFRPCGTWKDRVVGHERVVAFSMNGKREAPGEQDSS